MAIKVLSGARWISHLDFLSARLDLSVILTHSIEVPLIYYFEKSNISADNPEDLIMHHRLAISLCWWQSLGEHQKPWEITTPDKNIAHYLSKHCWWFRKCKGLQPKKWNFESHSPPNCIVLSSLPSSACEVRKSDCRQCTAVCKTQVTSLAGRDRKKNDG